MALEIEGKVYKINPEQSGQGANGPWRRQEFVIETLGDFPRKVCFEAWNDRADAIKVLKPGELVRVSFRAESREFNDRWYTNLRTWRIEKLTTTDQTGGASNQDNSATSGPPIEPPDDINDAPSSEEDDLPF